jgi:hypothetical protein
VFQRVREQARPWALLFVLVASTPHHREVTALRLPARMAAGWHLGSGANQPVCTQRVMPRAANQGLGSIFCEPFCHTSKCRCGPVD